MTAAVTDLMNWSDNLHDITLEQKAPDLAQSPAACVHGNDLLVEAGEAPLVLGDVYGLEARAITWHVDAQRPITGEHGLDVGVLRWLLVAAGLAAPVA
jgi:hypothetical protein